MEPFLLRKANDDRRLSIGASQTRHKDCRASRPLIGMAKAGIRHEGLFAAGLPNRDIPHRAMSIERLEPCEGKLSRTVLRGARAGDRFKTYPVHCCRDSTSKSLLSSLRPSGRGEAIFLACLDLGALEMCVLWHAFALRLP